MLSKIQKYKITGLYNENPCRETLRPFPLYWLRRDLRWESAAWVLHFESKQVGDPELAQPYNDDGEPSWGGLKKSENIYCSVPVLVWLLSFSSSNRRDLRVNKEWSWIRLQPASWAAWVCNWCWNKVGNKLELHCWHGSCCRCSGRRGANLPEEGRRCTISSPGEIAQMVADLLGSCCWYCWFRGEKFDFFCAESLNQLWWSYENMNREMTSDYERGNCVKLM